MKASSTSRSATISQEMCLAFDSLTYRTVLGQFATGITVVTTTLPTGEPWAMTANSFTSISLDPPIVLVSVSHGLTTNDAIRRTGAFVVNILRSDQIELARRYSRRERPPDQFGDVTLLKGVTVAPVLDGCLGWVECRLVDQTEQGDHTVFFGGVESIGVSERINDPLLYYNSAYVRIAPESQAKEAETDALDATLVSFDPEAGSR